MIEPIEENLSILHTEEVRTPNAYINFPLRINNKHGAYPSTRSPYDNSRLSRMSIKSASHLNTQRLAQFLSGELVLPGIKETGEDTKEPIQSNFTNKHSERHELLQRNKTILHSLFVPIFYFVIICQTRTLSSGAATNFLIYKF